eukprot:jgi/Chlat1/9109/Chrsp97S08423
MALGSVLAWRSGMMAFCCALLLLLAAVPAPVLSVRDIAGDSKIAAVPLFKASAYPAVNGKAACETCEIVTAEVERALRDPETIDQITDELVKQLCGRLSGDIQQQCTNVVDQYGPEMIQLLEILGPGEVCRALGICVPEPPSASLVAHLEGFEVSDRNCDMCTYLVQEAALELSDVKTQEAIVTMLKNICMNFPSVIEQCQSLVDTYAPLVFEEARTELTPDLCIKVGVCPLQPPMLASV